MIDTRMIIIEGIMGSGKSTLTMFVSRRLRQHGVKQKRVMEAVKHPTTVLLTLPNWKKPWLDVTAEQYIALCEQSWGRFVSEAQLNGSETYIYDGQFLHGDFTSMMMMNTPHEALYAYIERVEAILSPLKPVMVYLYQNPVEQAMQRIAAVRGKGWVRHQVTWKVESPYCQERGWSGFDGWVRLYQDYRSLTDAVFERLKMPKIAIDVSAQDWPEYEAQVLRFFGC